MFNEKQNLEEYDKIYSKFLNETKSDVQNISDNVSEVIPDKPSKRKICKVCGLNLDSANFYKDDSSQDDLSVECKKCSRKSYAVTALEKIEHYVEPDLPFKKEDILKQVSNRTQFLDYILTLQEFNLLIEDEKLNTYVLKPQKELNEFIMDNETQNMIIRIPPGVAHGLKVMQGPADLVYVTSSVYNKDEEGRIAYNDPEIGYDWIAGKPISNTKIT